MTSYINNAKRAEERAEARGLEKMVVQMLHQQLDLNIISLITGLSVSRLVDKQRKIFEDEICS